MDAAGIEAKNKQYRDEFEAKKAEHDPSARLRRTVIEEGELVALNRRGDVYRLNPQHLDVDKLERKVTGGNTPNLSAKLDDLKINSHQFRDQTPMEKKVNELYEKAAAQGFETLRDELYAEGILLARVDMAGQAMKNVDYNREFENAKLEDIRNGTDNAKFRTSNEQEDELVAVVKSGRVFRLNPNFVDRDALEKACQSSGHATPSLSETLKHFEDARTQKRTDRHEAQHTRYDAREENRQQNSTLYGIKQDVKGVINLGKDVAFKGVDPAGKILDLGGFLESLFGMKAKPPPMTPQQRQQRALAALEAIEESIQRGDRLNASDVANLLPTQLQNLYKHGDVFMQTMIDELEKYRKAERDRSYGLERG